METLTLQEFLKVIKDSLETFFPLKYWVSAEITGLRVNPNSSHCYLDLVEKDQKTVLAKIGGVIWKDRFEYISRKFSDATGQKFQDGMKVLLMVEVLFHEVYGFKLSIRDIDPSYTLGEFALHKKKIVAQLEKEGLLLKNKSLPFPTVPQKIAIISSISAAGYEDFMNTLNENPYGYIFHTKLFSSYMQGEQTEKSITDSLKKCVVDKIKFDIVIIIRGGGDKVDLHSFDNYNIGKAISMLPIPVITGIGHKRDETVADIVAHTNMISPTAVAEFIITKTKEFDDFLKKVEDRLINRAKNELLKQKTLLSVLKKDIRTFINFFLQNREKNFNLIEMSFKSNLSRKVTEYEFELKQIPVDLLKVVTAFIKIKTNTLERFKDKVDLMNPVNILKRGYSITLKKGKVVKNVSELKVGDDIETKFYNNSVISRIKEINKRGG